MLWQRPWRQQRAKQEQGGEADHRGPAPQPVRRKILAKRQGDRGDGERAGQVQGFEQVTQESCHAAMLTAAPANSNGGDAESDFRQVGSMTCGHCGRCRAWADWSHWPSDGSAR
ncbi:MULTISPECIES: hypothetical protein [Xanthomonas]|uniref:hypothetical protein n=1 Tax=Xanthomonas TaxID=338 RepID=UPI001E5F8121|nr:hypothetical protein [Xanthomonas campestris]MCC5091404.1 hypothetical protein [Xanthomonas campestris pv. incanae]MEA9611322.1 hypothetical protein [Xanthomonas campestris pv. incanae]MEA9621171.1 hypothetical protein [Xanthomonas campestris pv. incanae]